MRQLGWRERGKARPGRIRALEKGNRIGHRVFVSGTQLDVLYVVSRRNRRKGCPLLASELLMPGRGLKLDYKNVSPWREFFA